MRGTKVYMMKQMSCSRAVRCPALKMGCPCPENSRFLPISALLSKHQARFVSGSLKEASKGSSASLKGPSAVHIARATWLA